MSYLKCPCDKKGVGFEDFVTKREIIICASPICLGRRLLAALRENARLKSMDISNDENRAEILLESAFGISHQDYTWAEQLFTRNRKKRCRNNNRREEDMANKSPKKKSKTFLDFEQTDFLKSFNRCKITFDWSRDFTL